MSIYSVHLLTLHLIETEKTLLTNSIEPQGDLTSIQSHVRIHPFASDLIGSLLRRNLKYGQYQIEQIGDF